MDAPRAVYTASFDHDKPSVADFLANRYSTQLVGVGAEVLSITAYPSERSFSRTPLHVRVVTYRHDKPIYPED